MIVSETRALAEKMSLKTSSEVGAIAIKSREDCLALGPLAFWFLNHDLEEAELLRQMQELKSKGFAGFFMHPRGGMRVGYGSHHWRRVVKFCVEQAKALGLESWLYDEDPYPSGAAGGRIMMEHPEFRACELVPVVVPVHEAGPLRIDFPEGALVAIYLVHADGKPIERIDEAAGLIRSHWQQMSMAFGYYAPYQVEGSPHWRADTRRPHYQLRLDCAPKGATVVAFVQRVASQSPWGDYTDMLNVEAVELFLRYTHDVYAELLGPECGATVPGIFTDEAKLKGRLPWSQKVPCWFRNVVGRDLFEVLPHLVLYINESTPYYRWAYRKALAQGLRESMVEPIIRACNQHRLLLTGHVSPEEDPIGQVLFVPGLMGVIGRMDLPGTDLIGALIGSPEHPLLHISPKLASSAAHGYGKRWITCEAFAVCDWVQDMAWQTRAVHWLYVLGVNRLITHGQFYSIDGLRKREAPPSQFFQSAYWEHYAAFSEMVELLSRELGRGAHVAPVLLYYPEESFMALSSGLPGQDAVAIEMRKELGDLVHALLTTGYDFDFADEELLLTAHEKMGGVQLCEGEGERFEVVVVPGRYLSQAAWEKLQALEAQGVKVLYVEEMLTVLTPRPRRWNTGAGRAGMWESLRREVSPLWSARGVLLAHHRMTEDGPLLFLCNNDREEFKGAVELCFPGPYDICFPQEGCWRGLERLELELPPGLGVLIRQRGAEVPVELKARQEMEVSWSPWSCQPLTENCLVLEEFRVIHSVHYEGEVLPEASRFSTAPVVDLLSPTCLGSPLVMEPGDRYLLAGFDWLAGDAPLRMVCDTDLGEGMMEFYLNGARLPEPVRRMTYDPMNREVDLAPVVKPGRNHLIWVQRRGAPGTEALPLPYDALRLFGDFHVEFPTGRPVPARLTRRRERYETGFPVSAMQMGHPYYGGLIAYSCRVRFVKPLPERVFLEVAQGYESMEVRINGDSMDIIWCAPWHVEIPGDVLRSGWNEIELICSCSPANYLQALQRPSGFLGPVTLSAE